MPEERTRVSTVFSSFSPAYRLPATESVAIVCGDMPLCLTMNRVKVGLEKCCHAQVTRIFAGKMARFELIDATDKPRRI